MQNHQGKNNNYRYDGNNEADHEKTTFIPHQIKSFHLPDIQAVDEGKQTGECFEVNKDLDEDQFGIGRYLSTDRWYQSHEGNHQCGDGGDSIGQVIILEENTHIDDGQEPKGQKNSGQSNKREFVKGDDEVGILKVLYFLISTFFRKLPFEVLLIGFEGLLFIEVKPVDVGSAIIRVFGVHPGLGEIVVAKGSLLGVGNLEEPLLMAHEVDLDCSPLGDNGLDCDTKDKVDDLKGGPEDITLNSLLEHLAHCELDLMFVEFVRDVRLESFSELHRIISCEQHNYVVQQLFYYLAADGSVVNVKDDGGVGAALQIVQVHLCEVLYLVPKVSRDVVHIL